MGRRNRKRKKLKNETRLMLQKLKLPCSGNSSKSPVYYAPALEKVREKQHTSTGGAHPAWPEPQLSQEMA